MQDKLCHRTRLTAKLTTHVNHWSKHSCENCEPLEGQGWSMFAFKHDTVNLSFMYTDLSTELKLMTSLIVAFAWWKKPLGSTSKRSNFSVQVWTPWKSWTICFRLKTEKFAAYIFTDTILKPCGLKISGVTSFMNVVNMGNPAPALASEASSDRAKFRCVVAALFASQ